MLFGSDEHLPGTHFRRFASFSRSSFAGDISFQGVRFAAAVDCRGASFAKRTQTLRLDQAQIDDPPATSPEIGHSPSGWPQGWSPSTAEGSTTLKHQNRRRPTAWLPNQTTDEETRGTKRNSQRAMRTLAASQGIDVSYGAQVLIPIGALAGSQQPCRLMHGWPRLPRAQ